MRTTVTLDPDVATLLRRLMNQRGLSFKEALNEAVRAGLAASPPPPFETPTFHMGFNRTIRWDKALRIAGDLEDEELARRLSVRK